MEKKITLQAEKQVIVSAAMNMVYSDVEKFIIDAAKEATIANLGHELYDFIYSNQKPETVIARVFISIREQYAIEVGDDGNGVIDEYKNWLKISKKNVKAVQKKGLPLTLANVRLASDRNGPFSDVD